MEGFFNMLVPVSICAVLPICVVWIVFKAITNSDNRRADVLIKALESDKPIDADKLAEAFAKPKKDAVELLNSRLLRCCIFTLIGIVFLIVCVIQAVSLGLPFTDTPMIFLICGGIMLAIGVSYLIVYAVSRKQVLGDNKCDDNTSAED